MDLDDPVLEIVETTVAAIQSVLDGALWTGATDLHSTRHLNKITDELSTLNVPISTEQPLQDSARNLTDVSLMACLLVSSFVPGPEEYCASQLMNQIRMVSELSTRSLQKNACVFTHL